MDDIVALLRRMARRGQRKFYLEDLSTEQRRELWPPAEPLTTKHIAKCRLVENRISMLELLPKGSVCAELGIWMGEYSELILKATKPQRLYLIDLAEESIKVCERRFRKEIEIGIVKIRQGDSAKEVGKLPDAHLDWIYVDANHSYDAVSKDLAAILPKLKPEGLIALNDYTFFSPSTFTKYGVMEAVNEFCLQHDFELVYFALQGRGYNDVVIRRIQ